MLANSTRRGELPATAAAIVLSIVAPKVSRPLRWRRVNAANCAAGLAMALDFLASATGGRAMKTSIICAAVVGAALLTACHPKEQPERVDQPQQGRDETQGIRNTQATGYAGNALGDQVDAAPDAHEQARRTMDTGIHEQTKKRG